MVNQTYNIEVEFKGETHNAEYTIEKGVVSVSYGMITHTELSRGAKPEIEARRLLLEILEGDKWRF